MHPENSAARTAPPAPRAGHRWAFSIRVWLALASGTVVLVFLVGNYLARESTRAAMQSVSRVEHRFEPLVRLARDLQSGVGLFDRAVLGYLKFDTPENTAAVTDASQRLLGALADYDRLAEPAPEGHAASRLREALAAFHRDGLLLVEMQKARRAALEAHRSSVSALRQRIDRAGAEGLQIGENVFARRSLAELARAADAMRTSASAQFTRSDAHASARATRDEQTFRTVLAAYADELARSPGAAWLELVREDLAIAARERRAVARLDRELESARRQFAQAAERLTEQVDTHLQKPAWQALAASSQRARLSAQDAEWMLGVVSIAVLLVVLIVSLLTVHGVTAPIHRLEEGTRRLAAGVLSVRVGRGGVRELDELAQAFNHMAEQLAESERTVRSYQAELESRVSERTRQLRHLAHHDPLTDLPNRRQLFAYLEGAVAHALHGGARVTVLFIDLDNFKTLNDSLGHEFGDRVLQAVGERLRASLPDGEFVGRLGGDEFTVVLRDAADAAQVEERIDRLIARFQRPLTIEGRDLLLGVSIGVASCPDHAGDAESLLRAADTALFRAKELGRNRYCVHSPELLAAATRRFRTEQALRKAVEANELLLYFQPQVSLAAQETTAVEALLRWRQPDGTVVSAGHFLPIAEQSGLILELNDWVLGRTGEMLREWRRGPWARACIAINVSSQQFLTGNFVASVERVLRASGLPPECLEVELTEGVLQTGPGTVEALYSLRTLGVRVALDDFGTGYSSLTSLERLPLNRVKLDRSLIADVDKNARSAAIARSIVTLCRVLGLEVTAEGVERPAQLAFLERCGDVQVQGYLLAKPVPAAEALEYVAGTGAHLAQLRARLDAADRAADPGAQGSVSVLRPRRH